MEEQIKMDDMVEEMMEHICDELCRHPGQAGDPEKLEAICAECRVSGYVSGILNAYNRESTKQRWVPVEERIPGTQRILITNGEFVKEGYHRPDGVWKYGVKEDELFSNLSSKQVIAWMPLPEPYRPETLREAGVEAGQDAAAQVLQSAT